MTFLVSALAFRLVGWTGLAMVVAFCWLEWRRTDGRNLWLRIAATAATTLSLISLGIRPAWLHPASGKHPASVTAVVWTGGRSTAGSFEGTTAKYRFALAPAHLPPDQHVEMIPDLAYLRRHFPDVTRVALVGQGLLPGELEALRGCAVTYQPLPEDLPVPSVSFLSYPNQLPLGTSLWVQGSLDGVKEEAPPALSLIAPDGTITDAMIRPDGAGKKFVFEARCPPVAAIGRFAWKLRLAVPGSQGKVFSEEVFGVEVVGATLPRVLVLESSPHPDTAGLRRWLGRSGGIMTVRTTVGAERYRFVATPGAQGEFGALDESLLSGYDLVLADPAALASLTDRERAALMASVENTGLGVLVAGLPKEPVAAALLPGRVVPLEASGEGGEEANRMVRPQWQGQPGLSEAGVPAEAADIELTDRLADRLITDGQGHTVAASIRRGQGRIGLTLLRDTWRWTQENDEAAFAGYWSFLFTKMARSQEATEAGRWSLPGGAAPVFVDDPIELTWTGKTIPMQPALVSGGENQPAATELALAQSVGGGFDWTAFFWPREAGWHQVVLPATGATMNFFVNEGGWNTLRVAKRRAATVQFAAFSQARPPEDHAKLTDQQQKETVPVPMAWLFAAFFVSAGFLWTERYAGGRMLASSGPR